MVQYSQKADQTEPNYSKRSINLKLDRTKIIDLVYHFETQNLIISLEDIFFQAKSFVKEQIDLIFSFDFF